MANNLKSNVTKEINRYGKETNRVAEIQRKANGTYEDQLE